ncbi:MAG: hypothetical protein ACXAC5_05135 [Promethearchaeota archaeon]|jgi:hypothetical protein
MIDKGNHPAPEKKYYYTSKRRIRRRGRREKYPGRRPQKKLDYEQVGLNLEPYEFIIKLGLMITGFIVLASLVECLTQ